jgi:hypothetical protein
MIGASLYYFASLNGLKDSTAATTAHSYKHAASATRHCTRANDGAQDDRFREHIIRTAHKFQVATSAPPYASTATADVEQAPYPVWVADSTPKVPYNVPLQLSNLSARPDGVIAALYPIGATTSASAGTTSSRSAGAAQQQQQQQHRAVLAGAKQGSELLQREAKWGKQQGQKAWQAQAASVTAIINLSTKELNKINQAAKKQVLLLSPLSLLLYDACFNYYHLQFCDCSAAAATTAIDEASGL